MVPADDLSRLETVLRVSYGLTRCALTPMPQGWMNRGYRVECDGRGYFLKDYDSRVYSPAQISRACELQALVGRMGVPVPGIVPTIAGQPVAEWEDGFGVLSDLVAGRTFARPSIPAEPAQAMGRALGRMQMTLRPVEAPQTYDLRGAAASRATLERALAVGETRRNQGAVDEVACQVLRRKLASLDRLSHLASVLARLETQLTHGDYQETNVLFATSAGVERLVAVLDFDAWGHRPRGAEITRTLSLCFLDADSLQPEAWDFLAGYAEEMTLPEGEVRLFAPLRAFLAATAAWPIVDRYLKPDLYQPRWDRFIRPWSAWWEERMEEMTERLVEVLAAH